MWTNANAALEGTEWADKPVEEVLKNLSLAAGRQAGPCPQQRAAATTTTRCSGSGSHPTAAALPTARWPRRSTSTFGSLDDFKAQFKAAGLGRFGSGWAWLVHDGSGLAIVSTANQDSPISDGKSPLLGVDVWEHAYYLKYQNKRPDYIDAFWNVVNWPKVAELFSAAS